MNNNITVIIVILRAWATAFGGYDYWYGTGTFTYKDTHIATIYGGILVIVFFWSFFLGLLVCFFSC